MTYEYEYDQSTVLYVKFEEHDGSYDHEFGTRKAAYASIKDIKIVTLFESLDIDLTDFFINKPDLYRIFCEFAIEKYEEEEM